ncbi:hypothetical protein OHAE_541 [Ochrobactrum soli]|uniref:Uncharacterized protein n=1 Tax=Ochrobactrum soli TaxID=2448455 RepID=A0A2P9HKK3_9HYPH|nr:hypothetical protein OHAE_541 [[Ochrobactrum] soli]
MRKNSTHHSIHRPHLLLWSETGVASMRLHGRRLVYPLLEPHCHQIFRQFP